MSPLWTIVPKRYVEDQKNILKRFQNNKSEFWVLPRIIKSRAQAIGSLPY